MCEGCRTGNRYYKHAPRAVIPFIDDGGCSLSDCFPLPATRPGQLSSLAGYGRRKDAARCRVSRDVSGPRRLSATVCLDADNLCSRIQGCARLVSQLGISGFESVQGQQFPESVWSARFELGWSRSWPPQTAEDVDVWRAFVRSEAAAVSEVGNSGCWPDVIASERKRQVAGCRGEKAM
ncbi:hypothetical protein DENSPDRAFT_14202 [Dentipellis sp. KUC8613]|nr:hypothetical protein DENSPDRAFT_14202 [Dentipellis sp. KUC8613]